MNAHAETYKAEAREHLSDLEVWLLELENTPDDADLVRRIFRALHTIKGSGAMFGFDDIAGFTHELETVFDLVCNNKIEVTKALVSAALKACDHISSMLDAHDGSEKVDEAQSDTILGLFRSLAASGGAPGPAGRQTERPCSAPSQPQEASGSKRSYWIHFHPPPNIFLTGTNPILLLRELHEMGDCKVFAHTEAIPQLEEMNPELCFTFWDIALTTTREIEAIRDVFMFVDEDCRIKIDAIDENWDPADPDNGCDKLGEILVKRGDLKPGELKDVLENQKRIGEMLVGAGLVTPAKVESALLQQQYVKTLRQERQKAESVGSIRVSADKLDLLVNFVEELVVAEAMVVLKARPDDSERDDFEHAVRRLSQIIHNVQDLAMAMRMVPLSGIFRRMTRLVRDLSDKQGKCVQLELLGEETEVDKTVIEMIGDPLVHIVRNAVDHGIEGPEERLAAKKAEEGFIHIEARHEGGEVWIIIKDDGRGLSREKILSKGIQRGMVAGDGSALKDDDVFRLIFEPGLSTASSVTEISGRGVGMDIVKKNIEKLKGSVEIRSEQDKGTLIALRIPLTLAIMDGMLVRVGPTRYTIPLLAIRESFRPGRNQVTVAMDGQEVVRIRKDIVPVIRLHELFRKKPDHEELHEGILITIEHLHQRVCLFVDEILGQYQTVVKGLPAYLGAARGISGCSILGDGNISLILDMAGIIRMAERGSFIRLPA